jgi:hypothetical protein
VPLPLSGQKLAGMTGATIKTCIRIVGRMDKDDVPAIERDSLLLMNGRSLRELPVQ